jgi:aminoglycoside phosphotransferase (APT) family kinase protein
MVDGGVFADRHRQAVEVTAAAVDRVANLGFPETVVHGDFHAGNAALVDGRAVIIDWSDAAIGNPIVDLATWIAWTEGGIDDRAAAVDAWIAAWAGPTHPAEVRSRIDEIVIVGAAYQVISYDGIVRCLEPLTRYSMGGGAKHFLERLEAVAGGDKVIPT